VIVASPSAGAAQNAPATASAAPAVSFLNRRP
jgi:hypothetical protein